MFNHIIAADPLLLALYRGGNLARPRVLQVFEDGRAPWSKPLCKLGFHNWRGTTLLGLMAEEVALMSLAPRYVGFNLDRCARRCGVRRLWKPHSRAVNQNSSFQ